MITKTESEKMLTYLLAMQITLESMEGLEMTDIYRQTLPNFAKKYHQNLKNSILSVVETDKYSNVYHTDEKSYNELLESFQNIAKFVSTQPFETVVALGEDMKNGNFKLLNNEEEKE